MRAVCRHNSLVCSLQLQLISINMEEARKEKRSKRYITASLPFQMHRVHNRPEHNHEIIAPITNSRALCCQSIEGFPTTATGTKNSDVALTETNEWKRTKEDNRSAFGKKKISGKRGQGEELQRIRALVEELIPSWMQYLDKLSRRSEGLTWDEWMERSFALSISRAKTCTWKSIRRLFSWENNTSRVMMRVKCSRIPSWAQRRHWVASC